MGLKRKIHKFFIEHIVIFSPLLYFIYKHIQSTRIFFDIKSCLNLSSYKKLSHVCLINKNGEPTNIEHRLTFCFLTFEFFLNSNYKRCNEHHSLRNLFNMKLWWFFISWTLLITLTYIFSTCILVFFISHFISCQRDMKKNVLVHTLMKNNRTKIFLEGQIYMWRERVKLS